MYQESLQFCCLHVLLIQASRRTKHVRISFFFVVPNRPPRFDLTKRVIYSSTDLMYSTSFGFSALKHDARCAEATAAAGRKTPPLFVRNGRENSALRSNYEKSRLPFSRTPAM